MATLDSTTQSTTDHEEWRDVSGYEGRYQVSNLGRVKSLARINSRGWPVVERILRPGKAGHGYLIVALHKNGQATQRIHVLVTRAFLGNPPPKHQVNHIDGNKNNNCLSNLEYCTGKENQQHALKNGLSVALKGEEHPRAKLTEANVREIRALLQGETMTHEEIARRFSVSHTVVDSISTNRSWKHVK